MALRMMGLIAALATGQAVLADTATAADLWRGIVVVTARSGTIDCLNEYMIGESFEILYRPNFGAAIDETIQVLGSNGSFLLTSTDAADRTLRTGSLSLSGATFAKGFSFNNPNNPLAITPTTIVPATINVGMTGILRNAGLAGCNVTFRAALLPVTDAL